MERLTKKHPHGGHYMSCENCEAACRCRSAEDCMVEAISKLAAYEDSGLSPAEVCIMDKTDRTVIKGMKALLDKGYGRWIPVTERLPEEDVGGLSVDVLFFTPYDSYRHIYAGYVNLETGRWRAIDSPGLCKYVVTHWMPLPAEPDEEEEE